MGWALSGCVTVGIDVKSSQKDYGVEGARRSGFWHCSGHGCRLKKRVAFTESEWGDVEKAFGQKGPGEGAEDERRRMRRALAVIEDIVGAKTGTSADVGGSFAGAGKSGQMDCVDEMLNVATYVTLLIESGLVTEHRVGKRYTNHIFKTSGWPHTATSIVEIESGREYVVDSWWLRNGCLPYIVTREQWSEGEWDRPLSGKAKKAAEASARVSR